MVLDLNLYTFKFNTDLSLLFETNFNNKGQYSMAKFRRALVIHPEKDGWGFSKLTLYQSKNNSES